MTSLTLAFVVTASKACRDNPCGLNFCMARKPIATDDVSMWQAGRFQTEQIRLRRASVLLPRLSTTTRVALCCPWNLHRPFAGHHGTRSHLVV